MSEADTRALLIDPVLNALGWDLMDTGQVRREYNPYSDGTRGRSDYVLFIDGVPRVLVEAKKLGHVNEAVGDVEEDTKGKSYVGVATDGRVWKILDNKLTQFEVSIDTSGAYGRLSSRLSIGHIKQCADAPVLEMINTVFKKFKPHYSKDEMRLGVQFRNNTNEAMQLFAKFVVENRAQFEHKDNFIRMMRAFLNILQWVDKEKVEIRKILDSFPDMDSNVKAKIIHLSKDGKFVGIPRTLRKREYTPEYRGKFLNLIDTFVKENHYNILLEKLRAFADNVKISGPTSLTGIVSSLQPELFMPYNKRSSLPLKNTVYKDLANQDMIKYVRFNYIYKKISENTKKSLVELDVIANDRYWDGRD